MSNADHDNSCLYYRQHYQHYFDHTVGIDPTPFLESFAQRLKKGSVVWDMGCGSGRDLLWLKQRGFVPMGLERSLGLAKLARAHSGCHVVVGDFESFDFSKVSADGILMTAALVHIAPGKVAPVLENVTGALNDQGRLYLSMKSAENRDTSAFEDEHGRRFHLWDPERLESIFKKIGLRIETAGKNQSALGTKETWISYILKPL